MNWKRTLALDFGGGMMLVGTALWLSLNTRERQVQALEFRIIELRQNMKWPPNTHEEPMWRDLLAQSMHLMGPDHDYTLKSREGVSDSLLRQNKYKESETETRLLLTAQVRIFGADEARTRYTRHRLAWLLELQGRYAEAEVEYRALLEAVLAKKVSGWPGVPQCRGDLVRNLDHQKKYQEEEAEIRIEMELNEEHDRLHGNEHDK